MLTFKVASVNLLICSFIVFVVRRNDESIVRIRNSRKGKSVYRPHRADIFLFSILIQNTMYIFQILKKDFQKQLYCNFKNDGTIFCGRIIMWKMVWWIWNIVVTMPCGILRDGINFNFDFGKLFRFNGENVTFIVNGRRRLVTK